MLWRGFSRGGAAKACCGGVLAAVAQRRHAVAGFSRGGAAKACCGGVLAARASPGRWRLCDAVMRRPAEAGLLLTPAEAGCKLVDHGRARLFMNCAAKLKFP